MSRRIRITHRASGEVIAEGPIGVFGIMPFEGSYYIARRYLTTERLKPNWYPGLCVYKFLYVWLDLRLPDGTREPSIGWLYWLPNPLFFFTAFRPAVPQSSPVLSVEEIPTGSAVRPKSSAAADDLSLLRTECSTAIPPAARTRLVRERRDLRRVRSPV